MNKRAAPPPIEASVEALLQSVGQLLRRLRAEANPGELTLSQVAVLKRLDKHASMTTAELARAESVKPQSMGATLAALERDDMVERQPHPTDGRQVLFALTASGKAMLLKHRALKRAWLSAAMAKLDDDDRRSLSAALDVIRRLSES